MPSIDTVLVKVVSRCNLDCTYCYVYHMGDDAWRRQPKLISDKVQAALVEQLSEVALNQDGGFAVVLHGGEPLMLGAVRLSRLLKDLRERRLGKCAPERAGARAVGDRIHDGNEKAT